MRIVIEHNEFRALTPETQRELIEKLAGKPITAGRRSAGSGGVSWRKPVDLTDAMAARLLHGLAEPHRQRLELFAKQGGRVRQKELLAATGDSDLRVLSHFQAVLTRRLRRFMDDPDKRVHLIGWDFEAESWDADHKVLVDGIYYVTDRTLQALRTALGLADGDANAA